MAKKKGFGRLCLQLRGQNKIIINGNVEIKLDDRDLGRAARLVITAPDDVTIDRSDRGFKKESDEKQ